MCNTSSRAFVLEAVGKEYGYFASGQRYTKNLAAAKLYIGSHSARQTAYKLAKQLNGKVEKIIIHRVEVKIADGD